MPYQLKKKVYNASINTVELGTGDKAVKIGGNNTLPFYSFDAPAENKQKIGVEISDLALETYTQKGLADFYAGCDSIEAMAVKAQELPGVSMIVLHFEGADPNGATRLRRGVRGNCKGCRGESDDADRRDGMQECGEGRGAVREDLRGAGRQEHSGSVRQTGKLQDRRRFRGAGLQSEGGCGVRGRHQPRKTAQHRHDPAGDSGWLHRHAAGLRGSGLRLRVRDLHS